jgi:hypothetical protein
MAHKGKRKPGGGRKPAGPYSGKRAVFSTRIEPETLEALKQAARAISKRNRTLGNVSQFTEYLLVKGLKERAELARDPAAFHLARVVAEAAHRASPIIAGKNQNWHTNRFMFEALRVAVDQILERFKPAGEIASSKEALMMEHWPTPGFETPEEYGKAIAFHIISDLETDTRRLADLMGLSADDWLAYAPKAAAALGVKSIPSTKRGKRR